jgi:polar amino acid transport system substrate-binding protein
MSRTKTLGRRPQLCVVALAAILMMAALGACGSSGSSSTGSSATGSSADSGAPDATTSNAVNDLGTLKPGVIQVAVEPYMPYTGKVKGKIVGLDIDLLQHAADALHQKLTFTLTDLAGTIAATTSHRVDMTLGSLTWTPARAKVGRLTDPTYYSPPAALVRNGTHLSSISDFSGKGIGVETGSNFAEAIADVPGVQAKNYAGVADGLLDLQSGRIAAYLTDPLVAAYAAKQSATKGLELDYYAPPTADDLKQHPLYANFAPYQVAMFLNKDEAKLEEALNKQIAANYGDGTLDAAIKKWGGNPDDFNTPASLFSTQRQGVDRPDSWQAPSPQGK